jgi:putative MATE family efflux protein
MSARMTDFTEGSIPRHLLLFSTPMFLGNLLQAMYNTVDSFWVGRYLGRQALAAVSVGFPIIFALIALVMGLTMATTTLVAQYYGAGQMSRVRRAVSNSLVLQVLMGIVFTMAGVTLRDHLLQLINVPLDVLPLASQYMGIFLTGLTATFLYNASSSILRGLGDSRTSLRFLAYATGMNIVLDPLFIFGIGPIPAMGVAGVALATVISQVFSAVLSVAYLVRQSGLLTLEPGWWKPDWQIMALTFKIGLPAGMQQVLVSLSALFISSLVNRFGSTVVAGFGAAARLDQFAVMPSMSVGLAVSALVGQNLGAGKYERVREIVKWSAALGGGITIAVALLFLSIPQSLLGVFIKDSAVIAAGATYLGYNAFAYVPFALMFVFGGVLRGAGDTLATMAITLMGLWLVRVPLAAYLSSNPALGIRGVWIAVMISPMVSFLLQLGYYRTGIWKRRAIVKRSGGDSGED